MHPADKLIEEIDAAAFDDARFDTIVAAIARAIDADTGTLWLLDPPSAAMPPIIAMHRIRPGAITEFGHYWHLLDPWSKHAIARGGMASGLVAIGSELVDRRDVQRSTFYNEWAKEHGMHAMLSCVVHQAPAEGGPPRSLASFYRPAGRDEFSLDDKATLEALVPRLQATIRLRDLWRSALRLAGDAHRAFDHLDAAAFVLSASGRLMHANAIADALLRETRECEFSDGRLLALGARQTPRLAEAAALALTSGLAQPVLVQWRGPPVALCRARVVPLGERHPLPPQRTRQVLLVAEVPARERWLALAAQLYGLTPAETRVVELLATGSEPAAIAERLRLRLTTVRTHVRHALAKLGVSRASEVVRLLAQLRI